MGDVCSVFRFHLELSELSCGHRTDHMEDADVKHLY